MEPFATVDGATLYRGHAVEVLRGLPEGSVSVCLTSPPYHGLRAYQSVDGEQDQLWPAAGREAEAEGCEHEWSEDSYVRRSSDGGNPDRKQSANVGSIGRDVPIHHAFCSRCNSWRGGLGLEPDPFLYTEHLVAVFREVKRVLHATGVCWVNLGSSYAGGGRAGSNPEYAGKHRVFGQASEDIGKYGLPQPVPSGYKPTDLVDIPHMVAEALRADGWYLRAAMPWIKPANPMPESVRSRPVSSVEYWFMLTKGPGGQAFYDAEAVRVQLQASTNERSKYPRVFALEGQGRLKSGGLPNTMSDGHNSTPNPAGRAFRVSDLFLASLDEEIADAKARLAHLEACREKDGGLLLDEDGDPLALLVNPRGFSGAKFLGDWSRKEWRPLDPQDLSKGKRKQEVWYIAAPDCASHAHYHRADKWARLGYADGREVKRRAGDVDGAECGCVEVAVDHFAAFSEQLVTPLVRASCPPEVCEKCHAPKVREVKFEPDNTGYPGGPGGRHKEYKHQTGTLAKVARWSSETLGWSASCSCEGAGFVPGTVLDPFSGTGTVGSVCRLEGRRYVGIDCSSDYLVMSESRLRETGLTGEKGKQQAAAARAGQRTLFTAAAGG